MRSGAVHVMLLLIVGCGKPQISGVPGAAPMTESSPNRQDREELNALVGVWQSPVRSMDGRDVQVLLHFWEDRTGLVLITVNMKKDLQRNELRDKFVYRVEHRGETQVVVLRECLFLRNRGECAIRYSLKDSKLLLDGGRLQWPAVRPTAVHVKDGVPMFEPRRSDLPDDEMSMTGEWIRHVED